MASIHKRGGKFRVVWAVYADGHRIQRSRSFGSLAQARGFAAARAAEELRGIGGAPKTFASFLCEWLVMKRDQVRGTTFASYTRCAGFILRHEIAKLPLDALTAQRLEALYADLAKQPAGKGKPLAPRSIHHVHALAQNCLGDALRFRLVAENAAALAKAPSLMTGRRPALTAALVDAFFADLSVNNSGLLPLAALIVGCALRRSEALGVAMTDVDWVNGRVSIQQVVVEVAGAGQLRTGPKSTSSQRTLRVVPEVMELLAQQRAAVAGRRLKMGTAWADHGLLFPDMLSGGPMRPAAVTKAFGRAAKRAGWPRGIAAVHSLRHYAASTALAAGGTLAAVAKRLGHSSPHVTAAIYLHSEAALDDAAATAMASGLRLPVSKR
jgi:integrase